MYIIHTHVYINTYKWMINNTVKYALRLLILVFFLKMTKNKMYLTLQRTAYEKQRKQ